MGYASRMNNTKERQTHGGACSCGCCGEAVSPEEWAFWHCPQCLKSLPPNTSAEEWARFSMRANDKTFEVWCVRHQCRLMSVSRH